jgi:DNA-binding SARP family transcriptional activator
MTEATLGALLRGHRERSGLTQSRLAAQAGLSVRALRDLEQDRVTQPRPASLNALSTALGLTDRQRRALREAPVRRGPSVAVLGPLEIFRDGVAQELPPARPRRLLTLLALHHEGGVSAAEMTEVLWGEDRPSSVRNLVHTYIGSLRRQLEPSRSAGAYRALVRHGDGYRLDAAHCRIDVADFGDLAARGLAADGPEAAADLLGQALALWRGAVTDDADAMLAAHPMTARLNELRIRAALAYADAAATLGRHAEIVAALKPLAAREPLHEALHARLVRALGMAGRQSDALALYAAVRRRLDEELGVQPAPELQAAHLDVLTQRGPDTPPPARRPLPAQLPADPPGFTGRRLELARLDALLRPAETVVVAVTGTAGIGKTALTVHWAHRVRSAFPDGQIYLDLHGFDPRRPLSEAEAIRSLLDAMGVTPADLPAGVPEQVGLYRTLVAGRRVLILLDNAHDAAQARSLLPGSRGSLALVTSRRRLTGLVAADGAHPVAMDLLSMVEARELLARRLGADRTEAEPEAVDDLIHGCARLPLALAVVAARASLESKRSLRAVATELGSAHTRWAALDGGDQISDVWAVFSWSYAALSPAAARLFRLLGDHPGVLFTVTAAASLAGLPLDATRPLLTELTHAYLIDASVDGRYTMHDLLQAYAAGLAEQDSGPCDRQEALLRLLDHYLRTAHEASRRLAPHRLAIEMPVAAPGVTPAEITDPDAADAWFAEQHDSLVTLVERANGEKLDDHTWMLAWAPVAFFERRGRWQQWESTQRAALDAAIRCNAVDRQAYAHRSLAGAYIGQGRYTEAEARLEDALTAYRACGDETGQAHTAANLGGMLETRGRYAEALDHVLKANELHRRLGNRAFEGLTLNGIGWLRAQLGDYQAAIDDCRRALRILTEVGDQPGVAAAWDSLGYAYHHLGRLDETIVAYRNSLQACRKAGDRVGEAQTLVRLGETFTRAGSPDEARQAWESALDILDELRHPDADRVRSRLRQPV